MLKKMGLHIKLKREQKGLSQQDLSEITDYTNASSIARIENGDVSVPIGKLVSIAEALDTTVGTLIGEMPKEAITIDMTENLRPVYEEIVAGVPIEAQTEIVDQVAINAPNPEQYFGIKVNGESMIEAGIPDGCTAIFRAQQNADSGQIVAACVNGATTLKKYTLVGNHVVLMPANHEFEPIIVGKDDEFHIYGVLVQIRKDFF